MSSDTNRPMREVDDDANQGRRKALDDFSANVVAPVFLVVIGIVLFGIGIRFTRLFWMVVGPLTILVGFVQLARFALRGNGGSNSEVLDAPGSTKCPICGGDRKQLVSETSTEGKDFSAGKGICGAILAGPVGVLCGFCGKGKQTQTQSYWVCEDCGAKWKV